MYSQKAITSSAALCLSRVILTQRASGFYSLNISLREYSGFSRRTRDHPGREPRGLGRAANETDINHRHNCPR